MTFKWSETDNTSIYSKQISWKNVSRLERKISKQLKLLLSENSKAREKENNRETNFAGKKKISIEIDLDLFRSIEPRKIAKKIISCLLKGEDKLTKNNTHEASEYYLEAKQLMSQTQFSGNSDTIAILKLITYKHLIDFYKVRYPAILYKDVPEELKEIHRTCEKDKEIKKYSTNHNHKNRDKIIRDNITSVDAIPDNTSSEDGPSMKLFSIYEKFCVFRKRCLSRHQKTFESEDDPESENNSESENTPDDMDIEQPTASSLLKIKS